MSSQASHSSSEQSAAPVDTASIPLPLEVRSTPVSQRWIWGLPLVCSLLSVGLFVSAWIDRGHVITIEFMDGHGIKPEDRLKHKGIDIGTVERVELGTDLSKVQITVRIQGTQRVLPRRGVVSGLFDLK